MLPESTTVLIVGAGPTGLCAALSLIKHGVTDITIVDAVLQGENTSRALAVHAATLVELEKIDIADTLVENGLPQRHMFVSTKEYPIVRMDFSALQHYTKYSFVLMIPQDHTERILNEKVKSLGVTVHRPFRVVGMKPNGEGPGVKVSFDSGETIKARYIIGADGSKSAVRNLVGIGFSDPDGKPYEESVDERIAQMVLADVVFTPEESLLKSPNALNFGASICPNGAFLAIPLTRKYQETHGLEPVNTAFRIGFTVPLSAGAPPSHPSLEYIQKHIDSQGPIHLSSDPTVNPNPVTASSLIWSTRYRIASAIADKFYTEVPGENGQDGAHVFVVGDAAHIHSPAGGQGMNLGIRDAIGLGAVVAEHVNASLNGRTADNKALEDYAKRRHKMALKVIQFTKFINGSVGTALSTAWFNPLLWLFRMVAKMPFFNSNVVWRMSGLGNP